METRTLKDIRKQSNQTIEQIAHHMGVSVRTIYLWEKGEREISAKSLHKLMNYYQSDAPISHLQALIPEKC